MISWASVLLYYITCSNSYQDDASNNASTMIPIALLHKSAICFLHVCCTVFPSYDVTGICIPLLYNLLWYTAGHWHNVVQNNMVFNTKSVLFFSSVSGKSPNLIQVPSDIIVTGQTIFTAYQSPSFFLIGAWISSFNLSQYWHWIQVPVQFEEVHLLGLFFNFFTRSINLKWTVYQRFFSFHQFFLVSTEVRYICIWLLLFSPFYTKGDDLLCMEGLGTAWC